MLQLFNQGYDLLNQGRKLDFIAPPTAQIIFSPYFLDGR